MKQPHTPQAVTKFLGKYSTLQLVVTLAAVVICGAGIALAAHRLSQHAATVATIDSATSPHPAVSPSSQPASGATVTPAPQTATPAPASPAKGTPTPTPQCITDTPDCVKIDYSPFVPTGASMPVKSVVCPASNVVIVYFYGGPMISGTGAGGGNVQAYIDFSDGQSSELLSGTMPRGARMMQLSWGSPSHSYLVSLGTTYRDVTYRVRVTAPSAYQTGWMKVYTSEAPCPTSL